MRTMTRRLTTSGLAAAIIATAASPAGASVVELGKFSRDVQASCPTNCQALSQVTGYTTSYDRVANPMVFRRAEGRVVAFTVRLGSPNRTQQQFFNTRIGKPAKVRLSILKPYRRSNNNLRWVLNAASQEFNLEPFFGKTVQFPLRKSLYLKRGYFVALTVTTWAPLLAVGLDRGSSWRASRTYESDTPKDQRCAPTFEQHAHLDPGSFLQYRCQYFGARPLYMATVVTVPQVPKS